MKLTSSDFFHSAAVRGELVNIDIQTFIDQLLQKLAGCTSLFTLGKREHAALQT